VNYNNYDQQQTTAGFNVSAAFLVGQTRAASPTATNTTINPAPTRRVNGFRHDHPSLTKKPKSLLVKLQRVSDAWDDFKESRRRDAIYWFLRAAYDLVMEYRRKRRPNRLSRRAYEYIGLPFDKSADVFAAVIRGTSGGEVDNKTISKWSRALRYVAKRKRGRTPLRVFMLRMGGVNACANLYARHFGRGIR
jgi:hypothetical protein